MWESPKIRLGEGWGAFQPKNQFCLENPQIFVVDPGDPSLQKPRLKKFSEKSPVIGGGNNGNLAPGAVRESLKNRQNSGKFSAKSTVSPVKLAGVGHTCGENGASRCPRSGGRGLTRGTPRKWKPGAQRPRKPRKTAPPSEEPLDATTPHARANVSPANEGNIVRMGRQLASGGHLETLPAETSKTLTSFATMCQCRKNYKFAANLYVNDRLLSGQVALVNLTRFFGDLFSEFLSKVEEIFFAECWIIQTRASFV